MELEVIASPAPERIPPHQDEISFYREWLPLPKAEFQILTMIAMKDGVFHGNCADICRYLGVTVQNKNSKKYQDTITTLTKHGFIQTDKCGQTYKLKIIPKATEVTLPRLWVQSVMQQDYSSKSVAPVQVLKVFLWVADNKLEVVTNQIIAKDLGISVSTVISAKNVLERDYEIITKRKVSEKLGDDFFRTLGQELQAAAWWKSP